MTVRVLRPFKLWTKRGELELKKGDRLKLDDSVAKQLVQEGKAKPDGMTKIFSKVLNDTIWVVSDLDPISPIASVFKEAIYTAWEINKLKGKSKEELIAIHSVKMTFPGSAVI